MTDSPDAESRFLEQLGQRVRNMRALRGMSRKVLAKVSGISERYIAQLESGKGNVSIVLLRRVSDAMGAHLEDLLPSADPTPDWQMFRDLLRKATPAQIAQAKDLLAGGSATAPRRAPFCGIALIGLRGAGKSTLGRMLAKKIGWSFVELNKEFEQQNGLSVAEVIALYGQEGFRRMEQGALQQLRARNAPVGLAGGAATHGRAQRADGARDRRRHRLGALDLRPDPVVVLHDLAEGRARGAHGPRPPPGRFAPDGRRPPS